jgi:hypothetical protein
MSDSDLNYEELEVELGEDEAPDMEAEHEPEETEESEVEERGKDEPKPKVSNYVDFDRDLNEQKDVIKGRIGEYHRVSMTRERELEMVRAEKAALEAKLNDFNKQKAPEVPSVDLAIENPSEFVRQQKQYLEYEAAQLAIKAEQEANTERDKAVKSQEIQERSMRILEDAKTKGIDEKFVEAGAVFLAQTGMMDSLKGEILGNPHAAEILSLLATDEEMASELFYKLRNDPVEARVFLRTDLKAKALSKFVKKPSAPKPTTKISGARGTGKTVSDKYGFDVS